MAAKKNRKKAKKSPKKSRPLKKRAKRKTGRAKPKAKKKVTAKRRPKPVARRRKARKRPTAPMPTPTMPSPASEPATTGSHPNGERAIVDGFANVGPDDNPPARLGEDLLQTHSRVEGAEAPSRPPPATSSVSTSNFID